MERPVAVITGASSGIGAATARRLVGDGWEVILGARRTERLSALCRELGAAASYHPLDVEDAASVAVFCETVLACRLLVNNAGGAFGLDRVVDFDEERWRRMYESNVVGVARMTKALLPALIASGDGHVVTIGSIAAIETYVGGGGYNAAKHAVRAVMDVLRLELLGQPVRITEVDPGLVETEFSLVRFNGDQARANALYEGMKPLVAEDIADIVAFAVSRPSHVNLDQIVVRPRDQARANLVHRR